jgi:hypothetical protein
MSGAHAITALGLMVGLIASCATGVCTDYCSCPENAGFCQSDAGIDAGPCGSSNCKGCCTAEGTCSYPGISNSACGMFGVACKTCPSLHQCNAYGECQYLGGCNGCLDSQGNCQQGNTNAACGAGGAACVLCTSTEICVNSVCTANSGQGPDAGCDPVGTGCSGSTNNCCSQYCPSAACQCNIGGNKYPCVSDSDCCVASGKSTGCGSNGLCQ